MMGRAHALQGKHETAGQDAGIRLVQECHGQAHLGEHCSYPEQPLERDREKNPVQA